MAADTLTIVAVFTGAATFLWSMYQQHQINNMCASCPFRTSATYQKVTATEEKK